MHKFSKVDTGAAAILKVWRMAEVTADWDLNIKGQPQAALGGHHGGRKPGFQLLTCGEHRQTTV